MEENKMTDEEIVKALESLEGQYISYIDNDDDKCKLLFIDNILDFIQRLQSEKEQLKSELKKELSEHEEFTKRAKAEIERLTEERDEYKRLYETMYRKYSDLQDKDLNCEKSKEFATECLRKATELQKQVKEYQDKIERGTLKELPCKVGDTVWTINCWQEYGKQELGERYIVTRYELHENKCSCIEINDKNYYRGEISIKAKESYKGVTPWVFLTREEAEAKLKELQG